MIKNLIINLLTFFNFTIFTCGGAGTNNVAFETYEAFCNVEIFIKMNDWELGMLDKQWKGKPERAERQLKMWGVSVPPSPLQMWQKL